MRWIFLTLLFFLQQCIFFSKQKKGNLKNNKAPKIDFEVSLYKKAFFPGTCWSHSSLTECHWSSDPNPLFCSQGEQNLRLKPNEERIILVLPISQLEENNWNLDFTSPLFKITKAPQLIRLQNLKPDLAPLWVPFLSGTVQISLYKDRFWEIKVESQDPILKAPLTFKGKIQEYPCEFF